MGSQCSAHAIISKLHFFCKKTHIETEEEQKENSQFFFVVARYYGNAKGQRESSHEVEE